MLLQNEGLLLQIQGVNPTTTIFQTAPGNRTGGTKQAVKAQQAHQAASMLSPRVVNLLN